MKHLAPLLLCLALAAPGFAASDSEEPPMSYTLEVDGRPQKISLGTPLNLKGTFTDPKIRLTASDTRQFTYGEMEFLYPASFGWEADIAGKNEKTWILSGNDFKIMVFVLPNALTAEDFAEVMVTKFGKGNTRRSATSRNLGAQERNGQLLDVKIAESRINIEIFALPGKIGSRLLVLQDSPPEGGAVSKEGKKALDLLANSLQVR